MNEIYPIDEKIPFLEDIEIQAADNSDAETLTETLVNNDDDELLPHQKSLAVQNVLCWV